MRFLQVVDVKMRSLPTNCCGARLRLGSSGSLTAANTFGPNGLISRRIASATSFYTFDPLGNAANVINASGLLQFNCAYDAYGQPYGNATTLTYGYGAQYGYYRDSEATTSDNLLLCTYRWYDPGTARWLTRDPIGYAGGSNLYGYVGGNPVGGVDPLGMEYHFSISLGVGIVGQWFRQSGCAGLGATVTIGSSGFHLSGYTYHGSGGGIGLGATGGLELGLGPWVDRPKAGTSHAPVEGAWGAYGEGIGASLTTSYGYRPGYRGIPGDYGPTYELHNACGGLGLKYGGGLGLGLYGGDVATNTYPWYSFPSAKDGHAFCSGESGR
jgi:RHS repeat-associated protein